ncbi:unnamed protein product, partial [Symbiodinium sp. KB8]
MDLDVWSDTKYVMLSRFIKNHKSWRQCVADYMDIALEDAKVELIRLFYGGKPSCDIPFLVKLCTEIQDAAQAIVQRESSRRWQQLYSERRDPEFWLLSAILSMDEASMLASVSSLLGGSMCVLLFDGAIIRCRDLRDDISLFHALETDDFGNCLLTALYYMEDECDLGELSETELHDGISARDFNLSSMHLSQRDDDVVYALKWLPDGFSYQDAQNGAVYVFHEKGASEAPGHWWTAKICGTTQMAIFDARVQGAQFQDVLEEIDGTTAFLLTLTTSSDPLDMPPGSAYDLRGRGPSTDGDDVLFVSTPVQTCVECGAPLAPAHAVSGRLYTLQGIKPVEVTTKRCSRKSCRVHHHYNYRKVHGQKYHSLSLQDLEYVFVNSKVGFDRTFLEYHDALQFRGGVSHNAIEFAQSQVLWEDADQRYRWHRECASAQLYHSVVLESNEMWAHSTDGVRKRIFNIDIDDPLSNNFLVDYQEWWHKHQLSRAEWRKVAEVVMDGHEKVSGTPPSHVGRPRKDGHTRQRQNGWFMAIDPATGLVLSVANMAEPENNQIAKSVLNHVISRYATSFNTKSADTHIFYVLLYVKKHNLLIRKGYIRQNLSAGSLGVSMIDAASGAFTFWLSLYSGTVRFSELRFVEGYTWQGKQHPLACKRQTGGSGDHGLKGLGVGNILIPASAPGYRRLEESSPGAYFLACAPVSVAASCYPAPRLEVSSPVTQRFDSFLGIAPDAIVCRLDLRALTRLSSGAMAKRSLDAGEAGPTSRPRLLPPPLASTAYEEASSEPEEDPVGEPGPVIPSAVAKTGVPPPPPPPMHLGGDNSTMEAASAKASPIPATATAGPRPRPHLAPMRSGPPAPSPATPASDFLSAPGASEGVHIFVPGPRALSMSSFSWRRLMSGASDSSGAFDSSDLEREHLSTLDEQGRRLYLAAREDRLRRAEMGEVFGPRFHSGGCDYPLCESCHGQTSLSHSAAYFEALQAALLPYAWCLMA